RRERVNAARERAARDSPRSRRLVSPRDAGTEHARHTCSNETHTFVPNAYASAARVSPARPLDADVRPSLPITHTAGVPGVQESLDARFGEDVVATANALVESKTAKQPTQSIEWNIGIRSAAQDLGEKRVAFGHGPSLAEQSGKAERLAAQVRIALAVASNG